VRLTIRNAPSKECRKDKDKNKNNESTQQRSLDTFLLITLHVAKTTEMKTTIADNPAAECNGATIIEQEAAQRMLSDDMEVRINSKQF
jgi:hypothetical protein